MVEPLLAELLVLFPCVAILGVRQAGKTTLLQTLPPEWKRFDLERASDGQVIAADPDLFFRLNPSKVGIDEAQVLPGLFPALRVAIDERRGEPGRFVITGSSSPAITRAISESLAGRVAIIELAPLAWKEIAPGPGALRLLVEGVRDPGAFASLPARPEEIKGVHRYWLGGGYPEPWLNGKERFRGLWMENYLQTYLHRDVVSLFPGLNREKFRQFVQAMAGISGRILNYSDLARTLGVSQPTARDYVEIAHHTFVWRTLPAFTPNSLKRIVKHPKGYVRDSGLLHHMLRIPDLSALLAHPQKGASWEGMVIEEIIRHFNARGTPADFYHYRSGGGAEVDLVIETSDGIVPVEIKHGQSIDRRELRGLRSFMDEHPCPVGLVVHNGEKTQLLDEKIATVPFTAL